MSRGHHSRTETSGLGPRALDTCTSWHDIVQMGGLGFIHYNLPVEEQVAQALRVKRHIPGFMVTPAVLSAHHTIADWERLKV